MPRRSALSSARILRTRQLGRRYLDDFSPTFSPSSAFSGWKKPPRRDNRWLLHRTHGMFRRARPRKDLLALLSVTCANDARTIVAMLDYISSFYHFSSFSYCRQKRLDRAIKFFTIRKIASVIPHLISLSFSTKFATCKNKLFLLSRGCD